ncbi:MAG TPA: diol dehydratase small subunit [Vicinamibacteria bacterium]|nr:diol dehydratase small subunit [Vicinamibacteria bacterium]
MRYPLYREARSRITLPSGRPIEDITREQLEAGRLATGDLGIHEETLRQQARIAEEAGFAALARNLERAAELTRLPDAKILEIYEALRRGERRAALEALAREIEEAHGACLTAAFLREAVAAEP